MHDTVIQKLYDSIDQLERSLDIAKKTFSGGQNKNEDLSKRVDEYERVISRQKVLVQDLQDHLANERWEEVSRHVKIFHGLAALVRDDARTLVCDILEAEDDSDEDEVLIS